MKYLVKNKLGIVEAYYDAAEAERNSADGVINVVTQGNVHCALCGDYIHGDEATEKEGKPHCLGCTGRAQ